MRRTLASLAILCLACAATGQAKAAGQPKATDERVAGWRSDLEAWLQALRREHYVWKKAPLPAALREAASRFKREVPGWSDERALAELARVAALAGDGHTDVRMAGASRIRARVVPVRFYQFSDGLFVIDAEPGLERLIGTRVVTLAGVPAEELMRRIRPYVARDNDNGVLWVGPQLLRFVGCLEAVAGRRFSGKVPARLKNRDGGETAVDLEPVPASMLLFGVPSLPASRLAGAPLPPLYLRDVEKHFWLRPIGDALYVQFNEVQDAPDETLAAFASSLEAEIGRRPPWLRAEEQKTRGVKVETIAPRPEDVSSIDGMVKAYYEVITGPAGRPREWSRDRTLYIPDLRFVETGADAAGTTFAHVYSHQQYVEYADPNMVREGFDEREIHRVTQRFGNIAHVFSTYETRRTPGGPLIGRGINSIELFWDGKRWWIASAIWDDERPGSPIPKEYLP